MSDWDYLRTIMVTRNNLTDVGREIAELRGQTPQLSGAPKTYYVKGGNPLASDRNDGLSESAPFNTIEGAIRTINQFRVITAPVLVRIYPHETSSYTWTESLKNLQMEAPVVFYGVGDTTLTTGSVVSGAARIVVAGGGLTPDEYRTKTILMTSGPCEGFRRTITYHDETTLYMSAEMGYRDWFDELVMAPEAGDTFEIVEPAVDISFVNYATTAFVELFPPSIIDNCGGVSLNSETKGSLLEDAQASVCICNINFTFDSTTGIFPGINLNKSLVSLYGVNFDGLAFRCMLASSAGKTYAGLDKCPHTSIMPSATIPRLAGIATSNYQWLGWGMTGAKVALEFLDNVSGYITILGNSRLVGKWNIYGGSFKSMDAYVPNAGLEVYVGASVVFKCAGETRFRIENLADSTGAYCLYVSSASVSLYNVDIIKTNRGVGLFCTQTAVFGAGNCTVSIDDDTSILGITSVGAPAHAAVVTNGATLYTRVDSSNVFTGFPVGAQFAVRKNTMTGTLVEAADVSSIELGGALPSTGDGRYGWIRRYK